jgi:hypothetical protein
LFLRSPLTGPAGRGISEGNLRPTGACFSEAPPAPWDEALGRMSGASHGPDGGRVLGYRRGRVLRPRRRSGALVGTEARSAGRKSMASSGTAWAMNPRDGVRWESGSRPRVTPGEGVRRQGQPRLIGSRASGIVHRVDPGDLAPCGWGPRPDPLFRQARHPHPWPADPKFRTPLSCSSGGR